MTPESIAEYMAWLEVYKSRREWQYVPKKKTMVRSCESIWGDCEVFIKGEGFIVRHMNYQASHKEFSCQVRQPRV